MHTTHDAVGQWATLHVRAADREPARRSAVRAARAAGLHVLDVAAVTRQPAGPSWRVELRVAAKGG